MRDATDNQKTLCKWNNTHRYRQLLAPLRFSAKVIYYEQHNLKAFIDKCRRKYLVYSGDEIFHPITSSSLQINWYVGSISSRFACFCTKIEKAKTALIFSL